MKQTTSLLLILIAFLFASIGCQRQGTDQQQASLQPVRQVTGEISDPDIIKTNCYVCHNPQAASHDVILAPPLAAVKFRYTRVYRDRESFINAVSAYLLSPHQEESLMPGAINKFGAMPPTTLKKDQVKEIAEYLYDNGPAQPVWFEEHFKSMHGMGGQN
jgi:mono/diheme cytochrome c family protein